MSLKKMALKGFYWSLLDKVVNQLGMFFVMVYLARLLGPAAFGLIGMLSIFIALSQSLVNSGFSQSLIQRSKNVTSADLSTVFFTNILIACALYAILFFSAPLIARFYNEPSLISISRLLFLVLLIDAFSIVSRAMLSIKVDFKSQAIASFFATIIGTVVAVSMANQGYSYWSLVGLTLVRSFITVILLAYFSKWTPDANFSKSSFDKLFSFGSKLLVAGLVATLVRHLSVLLIGRSYGATDVGYYTQAYSLTNTLSLLISSIFQQVTYPLLTSVNDDVPRMLSIYEKLVQITIILTIPVFVGFALISDDFVMVFLGDEWAAIVPLCVIFSFTRLMTPLSAINLNILNAVGRSDLFLKADLVKLPMMLLAIFLAVPFGIVAVAWAMLVTVFFSFFINAYYPGKMFGFGAWKQIKYCVKPILAALVMCAAVIIIDVDDPLLSLCSKIITGLVTYSFTLIMLRTSALSDVFKLIRS